MLSPEKIDALNVLAGRVVDPVTDYLLADIARRIAQAGEITSTAGYQIWKAQQLGASRKEIKKRVAELLKLSKDETEKLFKQSAKDGYQFDMSHLPTESIPFEKNDSLQQIVSAAVELAKEDFTNITQTIGMIDPYGNELPLYKAYNACCDYAFKQVFTGATDYNTAVRQACKNLYDKGLVAVDYQSGVRTSLEAAVRRNIMGGLGLMQEKISAEDHDKMGADGWEISAHAASAPDHEPIQGKQYSDAEYTELNNSLVRRIGTLNCGHNKTSPFEFYQYWRNVGDADVLKCIRMLTFLPLEQIDEMDHWEGEQLNKAKEILAYELTKMVHGEEEAEKAQATARGLFSGAADHENMPSTKLDAELVKDGGVGLLAAMVAAGLCGSNREARQLVQQGGVLVDGEKVTDPKAVLTVDALNKGVVIKKGKKVYHKVVL